MELVDKCASIPARFKNTIALHILKNILWDFDFRVPLILGIHGPSGEGKTFQCTAVLEEMGVEQVFISGREFENVNAGAPALIIEERYVHASDLLKRGCKSAALIINDLDACLGHWADNVQYTVNTQLVFATLMAIADYPLKVGQEATQRIPIIATGNDFTKLYAPLVREGRMTSFSWQPNLEEKTSIVQSMFSPDFINADDVSILVRRFGEMPVAFFSSLKTSLFDEQLLAVIDRAGLPNVIDDALKMVNSGLALPCTDLQMLTEAAKRLLENRLINHLQIGNEGDILHGDHKDIFSNSDIYQG